MWSAEGKAASQWSLRRRLLSRVLVVVALIWIVSAGIVLYAVRTETTNDLDGNLHRSATLLLAFAEHEYAETAGGTLEGLAASEELSGGDLLYQIWNAQGRLMLRSQDAPYVPLASGADGYSDLIHVDDEWRLLVVWNEARTLRLFVAEPESHRARVLTQLSWTLLAPLVLGLPLLAFFVWLALNKGLRQARDAAESMTLRAADDFSEVPAHRFPRELRPLIDAFNDQMKRLARALDSERRFTEDAAHELRTPLAAVRLQAQVIERSTNPAESQQALQQLISGIDRTSRLIDQLMTLARLDPRHPADQDVQEFPLLRIVDETISEFASALQARQQRVMRDASDVVINTSPQAVYIVLRNLLENAMRYSPDGCRIELTAQVREGQLHLNVSDEGPGIPISQRSNVTERFSRLHTDSLGSGFGLFIVRRVATALGGSVTVSDSAAHGASVSVHWPLRASR